MPQLRISEVAELLGVSDDTVRRWCDSGRLPVERAASGPMRIDGADVAELAQQLAGEEQQSPLRSSARNQFRGIVTRVVSDTVMAQVELQAGPFRVVSLMSAEAVRDLGLEPGVVAIANTKATQVAVTVEDQS